MRFFNFKGIEKGPALYLALFSLFVLALNVFAAVTVVNRQEEEIRRLEEELISLKYPVRAGSFDKTLGEINTFEERLPSGKEITKVLDEVFTIARKNGLDISTGDYSAQTVDEAEFSRYTISFPVEGRYGDIKKFIYGLETSRYPVIIEEITFSRSKKSKGTIELRIKLSTYFV